MSPHRCPSHTTGGNYGSRRTSLAARRSNPDHHSALSLLALSHAGSDQPHKGDTTGAFHTI